MLAHCIPALLLLLRLLSGAAGHAIPRPCHMYCLTRGVWGPRYSCIPSSMVCNGIRECLHGEDEANCHTHRPPLRTTSTMAPSQSTQLTSTGGPPAPTGSCGLPDINYPPRLVTRGDDIEGIGQNIVGGEVAAPHSYPWTARLTMGCGGSLISDQWIVTAAHCVVTDRMNNVRDPSTFRANLGAHKKSEATSVAISEIHIHPQFNGDIQTYNTMSNDVAVLKLAQPVAFTDKIKPICLPSATDDFRSLHNKKAVLAGWGATRVDVVMGTVVAAPQSDELKHLVLSITDCQSAASPMRLCAEYAEGSACMGDSGGPLSMLVDGRFTQVGIVSYGSKTCDKGVTNFYAHVPQMRQFIERTTGV